MTLANQLTVLRILLIPVFVFFSISYGQSLDAGTPIEWQRMAAILVFIAAAATDGLDGYIARRFDMRSELGAYLDALADKALLMSMFVALAVAHIVPAWVAILVVSRDVMIVGAVIVSWVLDKPVQIRPLWISKLNTAAQIAFAGTALGAMAFSSLQGVWFDPMLYAVVALTLASTAAYLAQWLRHMGS
jgi:cardiolipin synthase